MNAKIVRRVFYPLQERLLARNTFHLLARLEKSQWYSRDQMLALQSNKLSRLLRHANESCPYYARLFSTHRIDPRQDDPLAVLQRLPLLDKATIRSKPFEVAARAVLGKAKRMSTGGSTGEPLTLFVDRMRRAYDKAARMRTHRWFGVEPGDKEAYLWGAPIANRRQSRLRSLRDFFLNDMLLSAFDLSPERARGYLQKMEAFNPVCIFGYPSSIAKLCEFARADGLQPQLRSMKTVFVTGEVLDEQQRRSIETFFEVPVADGYGGRDSGFCAHQCPHGGMHVTSEHIIMEMVDAAGRPLPPGESGEIVITNLDNFATPLIRYRTGDIGTLLDTRCPCRRGLQVIGVVRGRQSDHLVASDGSLRHALSLIYVLRELSGVRQFQVHQKRDRSIDLRLVADHALNEQTRARALRGVRECLGESLDTRVQVVDHIDTSPSGKFRHVISDAV